MRQVQRLTPIERQEWARAMAAELPCTPSGPASLRFALGCFWAAVRLRTERGHHRITNDVALGVLIGALFSVHAAVPDTQAWPLIWPAVGGVIAVLMSVKNKERRSGFTGTSVKTGATSAIVFFVGVLGFLWWIGAPDLQSRISVLGVGAGLGMLISAFSAGLAGACIRSR